MKRLTYLFAITLLSSCAIFGYTWQDLRIIADNHERMLKSFENVILIAAYLQAKQEGILQEIPAYATPARLGQLCGQAAYKTDAAVLATENVGYVYPDRAKLKFQAVIAACNQAYKTGDTNDCLHTIFTTPDVVHQAILTLSSKERAAVVGIIIENILSDIQNGVIEQKLDMQAQELLEGILPRYHLETDPDYAAQIGTSVKQQLEACIGAADQSACKENFHAVIALLKQFNEAQ